MEKIKFAIIGFGYIGNKHAEMILKNSETELVAIVDIKPKLTFLNSNKGVKYFSSIDELLNSKLDFDVVTIATPNGIHAEQSLLALDFKKHVVIEKPIALNKSDAEKIIFKSLQVKRNVFAVMQNRYSPPSLWLKELIESKVLGEIYMVQLNCFWNRDNRYYTEGSWHGTKNLDGGTLFTQFSHFIDILYWLFGDIKNIKSKLFDFNHSKLTEFEDSGIVTFDFVNHGTGVLNFSTSIWDSNLESSMTIIAKNGSVKVGGQYMDKVEFCNIDNYVMPQLGETNPGNDYGYYKGSAQNHHFVIENVVDVLKNRKFITTNALEGLKVVEIIEQIYKS